MMNFKLTLSIVIIILVIVFAGWLLYANYTPSDVGDVKTNQESAQDSAVDSTLTIESDLNQIPDDSSVNGDMNSLDTSLEAF
ncbi:MAG: hypothetical protein EXS48_01350 [Candidatus Staskawiczbacteria bacterium]|nr:hypothetical protein [Candidatus Staskawiczbacteria bacterium]